MTASLANMTVKMLLISFTLSAATVSAQSSAPEAPAPTRQGADLKVYVDLTLEVQSAVEAVTACLQTVNDRATADVAAPRVAESARKFKELTTRMQALPGPAEVLSEEQKDVLRSVMFKSEATIIPPLTEAVKRLQDQGFYGSQALREAVEAWLEVGGRLCRHGAAAVHGAPKAPSGFVKAGVSARL